MCVKRNKRRRFAGSGSRVESGRAAFLGPRASRPHPVRTADPIQRHSKGIPGAVNDGRGGSGSEHGAIGRLGMAGKCGGAAEWSRWTKWTEWTGGCPLSGWWGTGCFGGNRRGPAVTSGPLGPLRPPCPLNNAPNLSATLLPRCTAAVRQSAYPGRIYGLGPSRPWGFSG